MKRDKPLTQAERSTFRVPRARNCSGCRYWSQMIAVAQDASVEAMCLVRSGPFAKTYVFGNDNCDSYARNSHGAVDEPPNYGEAARTAYAEEAAKKHENGQPMYAPDGTMLDDKGNRSIFDDVAE